MDKIRIATRKSALALWQAEHVAGLLRRHHPGLEVELVKMVTQGDKILDVPLAKVGGKGLFVKELEQGLLDGRADIAVHSLKDLPAEIPAGLQVPVVLPREDPRDAFVANHYDRFEDLPAAARIGTSSLRRQAQLRARYPEMSINDLRGNVDTRLRKLDDGEYDAIILAAAGLKRLGFGQRIRQALAPEISLPAIGQGTIGVQCREGDETVYDMISPLLDGPTYTRTVAERAMNRRLQGGCQVPLAGYAELPSQHELKMRGFVGHPDGSHALHGNITGRPEEAAALGTRLAEDLLNQGADKILREIYGAQL